VPPVDFCNDVDPRARPSTLQTPKHDSATEAAVLAGSRAPLRATTSQIAPGQGSHAARRLFGILACVATQCGLTTPVPASAAPTRIYPNLISTRAPHVACWYLPLPEVVSAGDRAERPRVKRGGTLLRSLTWRASLPARHARRHGELGGPLPPDTRESIRAQPHPRCLPLTRPVASRLRREPWILAAGLVTRTARVPLHLLFPSEVGTLDEVLPFRRLGRR
jgi:hypothetical protein